MKPLPLPLRLAAGIAVEARDRAKDLPRQLAGLPVTVASQLLQASMRLQQQVTELAIKGDEALSGLQPVEETPSWATFDEDLPEAEPFGAGEISVPEPRSRPNGHYPSRFDQVAADPWEAEEQALAEESEAPAEVSELDAQEEPKKPEWLQNYDVLSLPQLRARLRQFDAEQLSELLAYERATANRPSFSGMLERRIERVAAEQGSSDG